MSEPSLAPIRPHHDACKCDEAAKASLFVEQCPYPRSAESGPKSYHDLHITTRDLPRTSIFNMPYGYWVTCTRVGGWQLWRDGTSVAGEYDEHGLVLDVAGFVISDSLRPVSPPGSSPA